MLFRYSNPIVHPYQVLIFFIAALFLHLHSQELQVTYQGCLKKGAGGGDYLANPRCVRVGPGGRYVYVTSYLDDAVTWFSRDTVTGNLTHSGYLRDGEPGIYGLDGVSFLEFGPGGSSAYATGFIYKSIAWYTRDAATGALEYQGLFRHDEGDFSLINALPIAISPGGGYLYAGAKTPGAINWFMRDVSTGTLTYTPGSYVRDDLGGVDGLAGLTSLVYSPDGLFLYGAGPADSAVCWFKAQGDLVYQGLLRYSPGSEGLLDPGFLVMGPGGGHIYVNSFEEGAVCWLKRDSITGSLSYAGGLKQGLVHPRGMVMGPAGKYLYVTDNAGHSLTWYKRDTAVGTLTYAGQIVDGQGADGLKGAYFADISADGRVLYLAADSEAAVSWYSLNYPPLFSMDPGSLDTLTAEDQLYADTVIAVDKDGDQVAYYTILASPTGLSIDSLTGVLSWNPGNADTGSHQVKLLARDTWSAYDTLQFSLYVANINDPPIFTTVPLLLPDTLLQDQLFVYQLAASDVDNASLIYRIVSGPSSLGLDTAGGLVSWQPPNADTGSHSLVLAVTDGVLTDTLKKTIYVKNINDPPEFITLPSQADTTIMEDSLYTFALSASDIDSPFLRFSLLTGHDSMHVDSNSGQISWRPAYDSPGLWQIIAVVTDGSLRDTLNFTLTVLNKNNNPEFSLVNPSKDTTIFEGDSVDFRALIFDGDMSDTLIAAWVLNGVVVSTAVITNSDNGIPVGALPSGSSLEPTYHINGSSAQYRYHTNFSSAGRDSLALIVRDSGSVVYCYWHVTVLNTPLPPQAKFPLESEALAGYSSLYWRASGDPDLGSSFWYQVQVSSDSTFTSIPAFSDNIDSLSVVIDSLQGAGNLPRDTMLYWRVQAISSAAYTTGYTTGRFILPMGFTSVRSVPPGAFVSANCPNPFSGSTVISFGVPGGRGQMVKVRVFNTKGDLLTTLTQGTLNPGAYSREWKPGSIPPGIYLYEVIIGPGFRHVGRMLKYR